MKKLFAFPFILLPAWLTQAQTNGPSISAIAVLTIHVSNTNVHQSVFEFLTSVLKLPVEYGPEMLGSRRYAAVYAGNMFIEPCGPFVDMKYPVKDFEAIFFGLNCGSDRSSDWMANNLGRLKIPFERLSTNSFRIRHPVLSDGIYLAISTGPEKKSDLEKEASFQKAMEHNQEEGLGLEYVKEIWLGYTSPAELDLWSEFLLGALKLGESCWKLDHHQCIRLVKSERKGVQAIVWKVHSLEKAEEYLKKVQCFGGRVDGKIELDRKRTCGLRMYLSAE